ncbi:MAG: TonB-dependent receptor plug domain-containing protein [Alistipes finegoldii]
MGYGTRKGERDGFGGHHRLEGVRQTPDRLDLGRPAGHGSGVTVTTQSGAPGDDGGAIRIRGINSFGGSSTSPLVLIDGIEGSLDSVDPNLIESISILKDAASSSIYGSRAANGVILVTTKRGSKERFSITYKGYVGWQSPTDLPDMVNALEFRELTRAMYLNDGVDLNGEKPGAPPFPITTTRIWRYTAKTGARTRIFIPIRTGRTPC